MPVDWDARIARAIAAERERTQEFLLQVVIEMQEQSAGDIERATSGLSVQVAEARAALAEMKVAIAELHVTLANERAERSSVLGIIPRVLGCSMHAPHPSLNGTAGIDR